MGIWTPNLIEELAYRRGIIFFGSGVSATAQTTDGKHPETWSDFICKIKSIIKNPSPSDLSYIDNKINQSDYLSALQAIFDLSDPGEYGKFIKDSFGRVKYEPSSVHTAIKNIDCKITITTNFDKIYEKACAVEGYYTVLTYDDPKAIVNNIKSPDNLIIKAHGSIENVDDIIFTAKQYYECQEKYPEFYDILYSLFLTNTVLFVGYSLNDPDINLVLQYLHKTASMSTPHYLAMPEGVPSQQKKFWKDTYNVQIIEYGKSTNDFPEAMNELCNQVLLLREQRSIS